MRAQSHGVIGVPGVTRDGKVGLKTELSGDGRHNLTTLAVTSECSTLDERLNTSGVSVAPMMHSAKRLASTKNWVSKTPGVESKGDPCGGRLVSTFTRLRREAIRTATSVSTSY